MTNCLRWDGTAPGAGGETAPPAGDSRPDRYLVAVMLLTAAAALDVTRCGLVMETARSPGPTAGLVAAGLAAAALTARTARGCRSGRRWAGWAALLIGAASPPQAAASGFHGPYAIPDTATTVLGVLLAVTILATAGRTERLSGLFRPGRRAERGRAEGPGEHAEGDPSGLGQAGRQPSGPAGAAAARRPGSDSPPRSNSGHPYDGTFLQSMVPLTHGA